MSAAVISGGSPPRPAVLYGQLSSPLALSGTIPGSSIAAVRVGGVSGLSPVAARPPLLSYNSTDTVSTGVTSLSTSPSDTDTVHYSNLADMAGPSAQNAFTLYEEYPPTLENLQNPPLVSALPGGEATLELKSNATDFAHSGSEGEAEPTGPGTSTNKNYRRSFYDLNQIKHRRRTTAAQLEVLDAYFEESRKPDMETRRQISSKLGMTIREVQVWFQNRRAKQKKLESRAAAAAEGALSAPALAPANLTAPTQRPPLFQSSYSAYSGQSMPPYGPVSDYGNVYSQPPFTAVYSNQPSSSTSTFPNVNASASQSQIPRQHQQVSYLTDAGSGYPPAQASYDYARDERALSPGGYNNTVSQPSYSTGISLAWNANQPQFYREDNQNQSVSVSPVSSRSSSHDEGLIAHRRRSTVPAALSNLSGLCIVPEASLQSPAEAPSYFPSIPVAPAAVPLAASIPPTSLYSDNTGNLNTYQLLQPPYSAAAVVPTPAVVSPTSQLFPAQSGSAVFFPTDMTTYSTTLGLTQSFAPSAAPPVDISAPIMQPLATPLDPLAQSIPIQAPAPQSPLGFASILNAPMSNSEEVLQMSANLAGRRQSMIAYPFPTMETAGVTSASVISGQTGFNGNEHLGTLPGAFTLADEANLPVRRASTSAINTVPHQRHASTFQPIAPRPSARQRPPIPIGTSLIQSPSGVNGEASNVSCGPTSPVTVQSDHSRNYSTEGGSGGASGSVAILGGLRRGSLAKRVKSPTSSAPLYQPYSIPHVRNSSITDVVNTFENIH